MAICFYWNDKKIGGVPVEFSLLINHICKNLHVKLFVAKDSFLLTNIKHKELIDIHIIEDIGDEKISQFINKEDVFILTTFPEFIYKYNINCRIWFWNVFPTTITDINRILCYFDKKNCQKMLDIMLNKSGIAFMDDTGISNAINNQINLSSNIPYFPVVVEKTPYKYKTPSLNNNLNIIYIGRSVIWKVTPALKIIKDIEKTKYKDKVVLTIITDDKDLFIKLLGYKSNLSIKYIENLSGNELNLFLIENCDLCIAMGTSCLDAAKLGIPSIVIDYSYFPISDKYKYTWLYNTKKYCLGSLAEKKVYSDNDFFLSDLLKDLFMKRTNLSVYSERCYSYVKLNHTVDNVSELFINYYQNTRLTTINLFNCTPLRRKSLWMRIKRYKNNRK